MKTPEEIRALTAEELNAMDLYELRDVILDADYETADALYNSHLKIASRNSLRGKELMVDESMLDKFIENSISKAYEDYHSSGYGEILNGLPEILDLIVK